MKKQTIYLAIVLNFIIGCKKEEQVVSISTPANQRGQISVSVKNLIDNVPFQLGQMLYTNNAGNQYRLDVLKYYLSNFEIIEENGSSHKFGNYELIDYSKNESLSFILDSIPSGTYKKIKFLVGIDSVTNKSLNNTGDLDISYGMFWSWSTGYIFLKAEGTFIDSLNVEKPLIYHFGSGVAVTEIEIEIPPINIDKISHKMNLNLDVNKLFGVNQPLDFDFYNIQQSFPVGEERWIESISNNLPPAFSLEFVQ